MLAHLWAQAPAPPEYIELTLCREFNCLPSALRAEPVDNVLDILTVMAAEAKVKDAHGNKRRR